MKCEHKSKCELYQKEGYVCNKTADRNYCGKYRIIKQKVEKLRKEKQKEILIFTLGMIIILLHWVLILTGFFGIFGYKFYSTEGAFAGITGGK